MGMTEADVNNQIQQMISFINQEAFEKVDEIQSKAEEEFNIEKSRLVSQQRVKILDFYSKKEKQIELQRKIQESNLANTSRLSILKARDDYVQKLKDEAKQQLTSLANDRAKYTNMLSNLIAQGLFLLMEKDILIRCKKNEYELVQQLLPDAINKYKQELKKTEIEVKIDQENFLAEDSAGGIELYAMGGKIKVSNTIEARLLMIFNQILPEIREKLFGANQNRKYHD